MQKLKALFPQWFKNYFKHLPLAFLALAYYRFPVKKLKIIGVTGTDGKTTTVNLIYQILVSAGKKTAMVSTVSAKIGEEEIDTGFHITAPHPWLLQKLLKKIVDRKMEYLVLEATSHGLDQFRLFGVAYEVGVLTNITLEHLDYHKTLKNYQEAKLKLFKKSKTAILNADDESFGYLRQKLKSKKIRIITYGIKNKADYNPQKYEFNTRLPGEYNRYNCLAAIATASVLGVEKEIILKAVASFEGVVGRMEEIDEGQNFKVIVDFAHTPNALKQVLRTLREAKKASNRLIAVFGAAGLRDTEKRPKMGKIAGELADLAVITAEDPRTEDLDEIMSQIAGGCKEAGGVEGKTYVKIPDRKKAIEFAIARAKANDILVICGKGHEKTMCFGTTEQPWSDQETVCLILKERKKPK